MTVTVATAATAAIVATTPAITRVDTRRGILACPSRAVEVDDPVISNFCLALQQKFSLKKQKSENKNRVPFFFLLTTGG